MARLTMTHHVGKRLRLRRLTLGLSQHELAAAIGIAAQQIQKYETGTNVLNVERLQQCGDALRVPIGYFFDGVEAAPPKRGKQTASASDREGLEVVKSFKRIKDPALRKRLADLLRLIAIKTGDD